MNPLLLAILIFAILKFTDVIDIVAVIIAILGFIWELLSNLHHMTETKKQRWVKTGAAA